MKLLSIIFLVLIMYTGNLGCSTAAKGPVNDTTINNTIILRNSASVEKAFGNIMQKIDTSVDFPDVYFSNASGSENIRMVYNHGDPANMISFFEIFSAGTSNATVKIWPTSISSFATESGIKLGITKDEILKLKGPETEATIKPDEIVLKYEIDKKNDKGFLKQYNMPSYMALYTFKENKLVKFAFGFDYP